MHVLLVQVGDGWHVRCLSPCCSLQMMKTGVGDFQRLAIVQLPLRVTDFNCRTPAQSQLGGWGGGDLGAWIQTLNQSHSHSQSKCPTLRLRQSVGVRV